MNKQANKILYVVIAIIIIIGAIVCKIKGFNIELVYSSRQEILISSGLEFDLSKIEEISKSILTNRTVKVQEYERFGNAVEIISEEITEEEKEKIITKINEEYNVNISKDDIQIINVPNTKIRDILKPYIVPGIVTFVAVLIYFLILYNKIGVKKVLLKSILIPLIMELTYYSIIAITRIPFGRYINAIALGLYVFSILLLSSIFQKENNAKKEIDE